MAIKNIRNNIDRRNVLYNEMLGKKSSQGYNGFDKDFQNALAYGVEDIFIGMMEKYDPSKDSDYFYYDKYLTDAHDITSKMSYIATKAKLFDDTEIQTFGEGDKAVETTEQKYFESIWKDYIDYAHELEILEREQEIKDSMSWFERTMSDIGAGIGEVFTGIVSALTQIWDLAMALNYQFLEVMSGGLIDGEKGIDYVIGDYYKSDYTAQKNISDPLKEGLAEFERKYTNFRNIDGSYTTLGKYVGQTLNTIGEMLPTMVANFFTGGAYSAVFGAMYYGSMLSGNLNEMYNNPAYAHENELKILFNASLKAGVEYAIEWGLAKVIGGTGLNQMLGTTAGRSAGKAVEVTVGNGVKVFFKNLGKDMIKEGLEEGLQELSGQLIDMAFGGQYAKDNPLSFRNIMDAAIIGAIVSGTMGGFELARSADLKKAGIESRFQQYALKSNMKILSEASQELMKNKNIAQDAKDKFQMQIYETYRLTNDIFGEIGQQRTQQALILLENYSQYLETNIALKDTNYAKVLIDSMSGNGILADITKERYTEMVEKMKAARITNVEATVNRDSLKELSQELISDEDRSKLESIFNEHPDIKTVAIVSGDKGTESIFDGESGTLMASTNDLAKDPTTIINNLKISNEQALAVVNAIGQEFTPIEVASIRNVIAPYLVSIKAVSSVKEVTNEKAFHHMMFDQGGFKAVVTSSDIGQDIKDTLVRLDDMVRGMNNEFSERVADDIHSLMHDTMMHLASTVYHFQYEWYGFNTEDSRAIVLARAKNKIYDKQNSSWLQDVSEDTDVDQYYNAFLVANTLTEIADSNLGFISEEPSSDQQNVSNIINDNLNFKDIQGQLLAIPKRIEKEISLDYDHTLYRGIKPEHVSGILESKVGDIVTLPKGEPYSVHKGIGETWAVDENTQFGALLEVRVPAGTKVVPTIYFSEAIGEITPSEDAKYRVVSNENNHISLEPVELKSSKFLKSGEKTVKVDKSKQHISKSETRNQFVLSQSKMKKDFMKSVVGDNASLRDSIKSIDSIIGNDMKKFVEMQRKVEKFSKGTMTLQYDGSGRVRFLDTIQSKKMQTEYVRSKDSNLFEDLQASKSGLPLSKYYNSPEITNDVIVKYSQTVKGQKGQGSISRVGGKWVITITDTDIYSTKVDRSNSKFMADLAHEFQHYLDSVNGIQSGTDISKSWIIDPTTIEDIESHTDILNSKMSINEKVNAVTQLIYENLENTAFDNMQTKYPMKLTRVYENDIGSEISIEEYGKLSTKEKKEYYPVDVVNTIWGSTYRLGANQIFAALGTRHIYDKKGTGKKRSIVTEGARMMLHKADFANPGLKNYQKHSGNRTVIMTTSMYNALRSLKESDIKKLEPWIQKQISNPYVTGVDGKRYMFSQENILQYLKTDEASDMNQFTFDWINNHFFQNNYFKSMSDVTTFTDSQLPSLFAARMIIRDQFKDGSSKINQRMTIEQVKRVIEVVSTSSFKSTFDAYVVLYNKNKKTNNRKDIEIDTRSMRATALSLVDGTIESLANVGGIAKHNQENENIFNGWGKQERLAEEGKFEYSRIRYADLIAEFDNEVNDTTSLAVDVSAIDYQKKINTIVYAALLEHFGNGSQVIDVDGRNVQVDEQQRSDFINQQIDELSKLPSQKIDDMYLKIDLSQFMGRKLQDFSEDIIKPRTMKSLKAIATRLKGYMTESEVGRTSLFDDISKVKTQEEIDSLYDEFADRLVAKRDIMKLRKISELTIDEGQIKKLSNHISSKEVRNMPDTLVEVLNDYEGDVALTRVKGYTSKEYETKSYTRFMQRNADKISSWSTNQAEDLIDYFENNTPRLDSMNMERYEVFKVYILGLLKYGSYNLDSKYQTKLDALYNQEAHMAGTRLSAIKQVQGLVNPNMVIIQNLVWLGGVEMSEEDLLPLVEAVESGNSVKMSEQMDALINKAYDRGAIKGKRNLLDKVLNYTNTAMLSSPMTWIRSKISNYMVGGMNKMSEHIGSIVSKALPKHETPEGQWKIIGTKVSADVDSYTRKLVSNKTIENISSTLSHYQDPVQITEPKDRTPRGLKALSTRISNAFTQQELEDTNLFTREGKLRNYDQIDLMTQPEINRLYDKLYNLQEKILGKNAEKRLKSSTFSRQIVAEVQSRFYKGGESTGLMSSFQNFIYKMLSDNKFINKKALYYFSRMATESGIEIPTDGMLSAKTAELLSQAYIMASEDYMHSSSMFKKMEENARKSSKATYYTLRIMFPFVNSAFNWWKSAINYSPVGLVKGIINYTHIESYIDKLDKKSEESKERNSVGTISSQFAEYMSIRDIGRGTIGTVGMVIGALLVASGAVAWDEEENKLVVGNTSIDLSKLYGSSGLLSGIIIADGIKGRKDFIEVMGDFFTIWWQDTIFAEQINSFTYANYRWKTQNNPFAYFADLVLNIPKRFVPNFINYTVNLFDNKKRKMGTGLEYYWNNFISSIIGSYHLPETIDPYTGEPVDKYASPIVSQISRLLGVTISSRKMSEVERFSLEYGSAHSPLQGKYDSQELKMTARDINDFNAYYGKLNNQSVTEFMNNKSKYNVKMSNGKYKELYYDQMSAEQVKNALTQIYSSNQELTKIWEWTSQGYSYYATDDMFAKLRKAGLVNNIYKKTDKKSGYVQ